MVKGSDGGLAVPIVSGRLPALRKVIEPVTGGPPTTAPPRLSAIGRAVMNAPDAWPLPLSATVTGPPELLTVRLADDNAAVVGVKVMGTVIVWPEVRCAGVAGEGDPTTNCGLLELSEVTSRSKFDVSVTVRHRALTEGRVGKVQSRRASVAG